MGFFKTKEEREKIDADKKIKQEIEKNKVLLEKQKKEAEKLEHEKELLEIKAMIKETVDKTETLKENKKVLALFNDFKTHAKYIAPKKGKLKSVIDHFFNPGSDINIKMVLKTGDLDQFVVRVQKNYFIYKTGAYIIDPSMVRYDHSNSKTYLLYHEDFALPIALDIPVEQIKTKLENSTISDIELSINPSVLRRFIESNFVEKVMKGASLDTDLGLIKILSALSVLLGFASVLLGFKSK